MVAVPTGRFVPISDYLAVERAADSRSEYLNGIVVAMAGASAAHNTLCFNISGELHAQLRGSPCRGFVGDMRTRVPACNRYYYPDIAVVCDEPVFEDAFVDTLLNPILIIEILSDSTEKTDRGEKFICCQTIETLQVYALVSQEIPQIECYVRQPDGSGRYTRTDGEAGVVSFAAIGCTLDLAAVYARVTFASATGGEVRDVPGPDRG